MSVRGSAMVVAGVVLLAACGADADSEAGPSRPPTVQEMGDQVAFELLGVQQSVPEMGTVTHAVDEAAYRDE